MGRRRGSVKTPRKNGLTKEPEKLTIHIKYQNTEETFCGSPEEVWLFMSGFFSKFLPTFETAKKLLLNVDLISLAKKCEGLIAFSTEGANILVPKNKLTDNETVLLWLLATYLGHELGMLQTNLVPKELLQTRLGKTNKITSTRLGELAKNGYIIKDEDEKYKITTFGITQMEKDTLSNIRSKAIQNNKQPGS
jgi:hypothetical protein